MKPAVAMLIVLILVSGIALPAAEFDHRRTVQIETGLVEGVANPESDVVAFKGIPYAAPPVGDRRWRELQPPVAWEGVRKAERFGAACPQPRSPSGNLPAEMSEDCLFLNVWTSVPSTRNAHAVLFFIHGGAGLFGSGNINGAELARKGVVVVSANYRLGILAGMGHPELTIESPHRVCGEYGMLDLIAALGWVQRNIGAFGGDRGRVTVAGQSSGACAVHYLTTSSVAKGLFHRAIAASFPYDYLMKPNMIPFVRQKEENGIAYASLKRAGSLADLRRVPAGELVAPDPAVTRAKLYHLSSSVARDGWAFPLTYPDALDKGLASDVPTLTGMTADDFGPPVRSMTTTPATFAATLPAMFGDRREAFLAKRDAFLPLCSATNDRDAREMAKRVQIEYRLSSIDSWACRRGATAKTPVYAYLFDHATSPDRGAPHGSDLAYAFNDGEDRDRPWTDEDRRVAEEVSTYWVNFVRTGDPNGANLPRWQPLAADDPTAMVLSTPSGPRPIAPRKRLAFYRSLSGK